MATFFTYVAQPVNCPYTLGEGSYTASRGGK